MHQDERSPEALSALLLHGTAEVQGRMPWSSNGTFLVRLCSPDVAGELLAVYKPVRGERGLWDFPPGLHRRETAAWVLSDLLGWGLVPETVMRDGPFGEGSMQRFVPSDFEQHYFTLYEDEAWHPTLQRICVFDLVANNTDRKSGHVLLGDDGQLWAIDNGLCFHRDPKVRTVIWEWGGTPIPPPLLADLGRALPSFRDGRFDGLLSRVEIEAMAARAERLLQVRTFPLADPMGRCYPWPMV